METRGVFCTGQNSELLDISCGRASASELSLIHISISNPFVMEVPRKLTDEELVNAIRQDIIGELEAIHEYDAHVQATDNEDAKKVLSDIRDEEREHMGELLELLERLAPDEKALHDEMCIRDSGNVDDVRG